jgi:hypothetical protein
MVAPIAPYPDPLLAQVLAAATFPVRIHPLLVWRFQSQFNPRKSNEGIPAGP